MIRTGKQHLTSNRTINECLSERQLGSGPQGLELCMPFALQIPLLGISPEEIMKNVHKCLPIRKLISGTVYRSEKLKTLNVQ